MDDSEMMKGVLGSDVYGPNILFANHRFELVSRTALEHETMSGMITETMCAHEDWDEFMKLVAEYSDTVEGDG